MSRNRDLEKFLSENVFSGFDESNHGRFPEIFTAVFSRIQADSIKREGLSKKRHHTKLFKNLKKRDYSFLLANRHDYKRIPQREFLGVMAASLLQGKLPEDFDELHLLFDGAKDLSDQYFTKDIVSEIYSLERSRIKIIQGPKLDKKYKIINLADELAHYFFKSSNEKISENPNLKYLLR